MGRKVAQKPLVEKLAAAANAVGAVPKKGKNQEYNWQRWADVADAFRNELFKRGIIILPADIEIEEKLFKNSAGLIMRYASLKREYRITDGNETLTVPSFGRASDVGDKAIWKAKTGCDKYLLRELGLIPDEADDPEAYAQPVEHDASDTPKQKMRAQEFQRRAWKAGLDKGIHTPKQAEQYLLERFKVSDVTLLNRTEFDEAERWLLGMEPLGKTLQMSVEVARKNGGVA